MWKQAKVTVGDDTADQAMVDFTGKLPEVLEWPNRLPLNSEIKIGEETYFAGEAQACAGKFHVPLRRDAVLPKLEPPPAETAPAEAISVPPMPIRKGK